MARKSLAVDLPAVFTAQKGLNEVRYASLKGIMAVKRKSHPDVGRRRARDRPPEHVPAATVETRGSTARPIGRRDVWSTVSPRDAARELVRLLHEEAKVL